MEQDASGRLRRLPQSRTRYSIPLGFGDLTARVGDHIVHLYSDTDEMLRILGPYMAVGISRGDRCILLAPRATRKLREWLTSKGVNVRAAERSSQVLLDVGKTSRAYGHIVRDFEAETVAAGYPLLRLAGDGAGALGDRATPSQLLRWEASLDRFFVQRQMIALCQYDLRRLRGDTVVTALKYHPLCVVGDRVLRNPFYAPARQGGLTPREIEVLRSLAAGRTDKEIAHTLGIGQRTVQTHVRSILAKMGVDSRTAAGVQAVREGIID